MKLKRAKKILAIHSGYSKVFDYAGDFTFTGVFIPYVGLDDKYFHEIMEALFSLKEHFQETFIDREIVFYIAEICSASSIIALKKDGMLQRNNLITNEELEKLSLWLDIIASVALHLLRKRDMDCIVGGYISYLENNDYGENIKKMIPFFVDAINDVAPIEDDPSQIVNLLAKIGSKAKYSLPALYKLLEKKNFGSYRFFPNNMTAKEKRVGIAEIKENIKWAISQIE